MQIWRLWVLLVGLVKPTLILGNGESVPQINLRLNEEESFEINMQHMLQEYTNAIFVNGSNGSDPEGVNNSENFSEYWQVQSYLPESNLSTECVTLPPSDETQRFNDQSLVVTRSSKIKDRFLYIATAYHNYPLTDEAGLTKLHNRLETVVFEFNDTHISYARTLKPRSFEQPAVSDGASLRTIRFQHQYIHTFRESVNLVLEQDDEGFVLKFERPQTPMNITLGSFRKQENVALRFNVTNRNQTIEMKLFTAESRTLEVWIYSPIFAPVYTFILSKDDVADLRVSNFALNWTNIEYIASTLMIFTAKSSKITSIQDYEHVYYLERYPGSKIEPKKVMLLGEFTYLNGFVSNEANEIVIETYQAFYSTEQLINVLYSTYSYNIQSKLATQTQTLMVFISSNRSTLNKKGSLDRLDSVWLQETILFLVSARISDKDTSLTAPPSPSDPRNGYLVMQDPYLGFGCRETYDADYNIYSTDVLRDLRSNQYFHFTRNLIRRQGVSKNCTILKQKFREYLLKVKCKSSGSKACPPNLQLKFFDSNNKTFLIYSIKFIKTDDPIRNLMFWPAVNSTEFTSLASKQHLTVKLNEIIRGSYIVHQVDESSSAINYPVLSADRLNYIHSKSMLKIKSGRLSGEVANRIGSFNFLVGLEVHVDARPSTMYLLANPVGSSKVQIFRLKDDMLIKYTEYPTMSRIVKTLITDMNEFLFFMSDGSLELLNAYTLQFNILPYPGVNCLDIDMIFHPQIKHSIICYNVNRGFSVYYLDELITKSLSNSQIRFEFSLHLRLRSNSKIFTSSTYQGYFFMFTKKSESQSAMLSVFYIEVQEAYEIIHIRDINLDNFQLHVSGYMVRNVMLVKDRFVIHYRSALDGNVFLVLKFNDNMEAVILKSSTLTSRLSVNLKTTLFHFQRAFSSLIYENVDPMVCLQVMNSSMPTQQNVLLIDPFSPARESFSVLLLPRHSSANKLIVFPIFGFGHDKIKKRSVGMLHYNPSAEFENLADFEKKYLFQFVEPGHPTIYFDVKPNDKFTPENVVSNFYNEGITSATLTLEDHIDLSRDDRTRFKFKMNFLVAKNTSKDDTDNKILSDQDIDRSTKVEEFKIKKEVIVLKRRFSELLSKTVVDWTFEEESIFDSVLHTIEASPPLKFIKWRDSLNWDRLESYDLFCYKYKKLADNKSECSARGIAFYFQNQVGVYYGSDLTNITKDKVIMISTEWQDCTSYFTIGYMIMSICKTGLSKYMVMINLLTLEQYYYSHKMFSSLDWKSTEIFKLNSDKIAFLRINQKTFDLYNRKTVSGSSTFILSSRFQDPYSFNFFNSTLIQVGKRMYRMYTDFLTIVHYFESTKSYIVTQMAINCGHHLAFFLEVLSIEMVKAERDITATHPQESTPVFTKNQFIQFTFSGSKEMKQTALVNANLKALPFDNQELVLRSGDGIVEWPENAGQYPIYSTFLLYFPNHHSFVYRYKNYFQKCQLSIYKLFNPFAGFENNYQNLKPECLKWACITVFRSTEQINYVVLYDMRYEWIRQQPDSNFARIFNAVQPFQCDSDTKTSFNLDFVGPEYTIYPLHIMRVDNLQLLEFDKKFSNEDDPEELAATVFYKNTTMARVLVNRNLKVVMRSLYVSSYFIDAQIRELYGVILKLKLTVLPFYEYDYYKYYAFMVGCMLLAAIYKLFALCALKRQEDERIKDFDDEFDKEASYKLRFKQRRKEKELDEQVNMELQATDQELDDTAEVFDLEAGPQETESVEVKNA